MSMSSRVQRAASTKSAQPSRSRESAQPSPAVRGRAQPSRSRESASSWSSIPAVLFSSMELFGNGSFVPVGTQLLCLGAFIASIAATGMKVTHEPKSSTFVLPSKCIADSDVYDALYISCFAALVCCAGQASYVTLAMWVLRGKKTVDELPAPTVKWCRGFMFTGVVFCFFSFLCFTSIVDNFLFAKVALFSCLTSAAKLLFIVSHIALALVGSAICIAGAYISLRCT